MAIRGKSGSGKSSILAILGGMDAPSSGAVFFEGKNLTSMSDRARSRVRAKEIGFMFQDHFLLSHLSIQENAALPLVYGRIKGSRNRVTEILTELGIAHLAHRRPHQVSGGERARAAVARALVADPKCIMADEPTGNLDTQTSETVFGILKNQHQMGKTIVVVSHDDQVERYANRVLRLRDGKMSD